MSGRIKNPDGSVEFICSECGLATLMFVDDDYDFPVCTMCRWVGERPWIDRMTLRGKQAIGRLTSSSPVDVENPPVQRSCSATPTLHLRGADTQDGGSVLGLLVLSLAALAMIVGAVMFAVMSARPCGPADVSSINHARLPSCGPITGEGR